MAFVDDHRIQQMLTNLVASAIEHTEAGGSVTMSVEDSDRIAVDVRDTGCGIPAEELPRIFDRFSRVDASRSRSTGGSGLGLAIAAEFVRAHGGSIDVDSEVGVGTVFTVVLPRDGLASG